MTPVGPERISSVQFSTAQCSFSRGVAGGGVAGVTTPHHFRRPRGRPPHFFAMPSPMILQNCYRYITYIKSVMFATRFHVQGKIKLALHRWKGRAIVPLYFGSTGSGSVHCATLIEGLFRSKHAFIVLTKALDAVFWGRSRDRPRGVIIDIGSFVGKR